MSQQNINPKELAENLRKPQGEFGKKVGEFMNKGNAFTYEKMKKHLLLKPSVELLEIGFGNGVTSKEIMQQYQYTGLDYSADMLKEAENLCAHEIDKFNAKFFCGDIHKMPFKNAWFDAAFSINTIYFWDKPEIAISELRRVLKEGGKFFIGMRTKEDMEKLANITQHNFTIRSLAQTEEMLRNGGFKNIQYTVYTDPLKKDINNQEILLHSVIFEMNV